MAWDRNELKKLSEDKAREEKEYKKRYAAPIPKDEVRRLGKSFFDRTTKELQRMVEGKRFSRGKGLFSPSYYIFTKTFMLECNDLPEDDQRLFHSHYSYLPESDYLSVIQGGYENDDRLYYKNFKHVEAVFNYIVKLCRESGLEAEYYTRQRYSGGPVLTFCARLPCDKNGIVK